MEGLIVIFDINFIINKSGVYIYLFVASPIMVFTLDLKHLRKMSVRNCYISILHFAG